MVIGADFNGPVGEGNSSRVAKKYVIEVQDMYENCMTVVRCAVGVTEELKVEVGRHQGSALRPFLFAMRWTDWQMRLDRNLHKTEYMCVNERISSRTVRLQGVKIKKVEDFKYLESTVQSNEE